MQPPFQVRTLGVIKNKPLHTSPGTKNNDYMINIFVSGKGYYKNNSIEIAIENPCVSIFTPDDPGVLVCDHHDPYHHYFLRYSGDYAKKITNQIIKKYKSQFIFFENIPVIEAIFKTEEIAREGIFRDELPQEMGVIESKLSLILTMLLEEKDKVKNNKLSANLLEAYLQTHLDQKLSLDEMSEHFHMSSRQLSRHSIKYFNTSLIQFHERLKINLAISLLMNSSLKINEIAYRLGYPDPLHFSRVFKKHEGMSPLNYKNR